MDYCQCAKDLLKGAYDLHMHTFPDHDKRSVSDFEALEDAENLEMAGIIIKNHYESTVSRAALVNYCHKGQAKAYGSITLNWSVGGLNPYAVEHAAMMGAKMIWLPTREAETSMKISGIDGKLQREPIRVTDEFEKPKKTVTEIFEIAKTFHIPVSTGHITLKEAYAVCKLGLDMGVTMVLSHPEYSHTRVSVEDQNNLANMGVMIEKDWVDIALKMATVQEVAASIQKIGASQIYLATDRGQINGERPGEAMKMFISELLKCGISSRDIQIMIRDNPERLLGI